METIQAFELFHKDSQTSYGIFKDKKIAADVAVSLSHNRFNASSFFKDTCDNYFIIHSQHEGVVKLDLIQKTIYEYT